MTSSDHRGAKLHRIQTRHLHKGVVIDAIVGSRLKRSREVWAINNISLAAGAGVTIEQFEHTKAGLLRCPTDLVARVAVEAKVTLAWYFSRCYVRLMPPTSPD